jgi:hypothetical protein
VVFEEEESVDAVADLLSVVAKDGASVLDMIAKETLVHLIDQLPLKGALTA